MSYVADLYAAAPSICRVAIRGRHPSGGYGMKRFDGADEWHCDPSDLTAALSIIGGTVEVIGGSIARVVPLRFNEYDFAIADDCDWYFDGWNHETGTYAKAFIKVQYKLPAYALEGSDAYLSFRTSAGSRPVPIIAVGSVGPAVPVGYEPVRTSVLNITSHNLATLDLETWRAYAGYTNSAAWRGYPARTLMFTPPESSQTFQIAGTNSYDVTMSFEASRVLWTQGYDTAGTLVDLTWSGGGLRVPEVNYATLFGF